MNNIPGSGTEYITATDLESYGITPDDMSRHCLLAVDYAASDDSPCWRPHELGKLLDHKGVEPW
jgi:hypothetical protein